MAHVPKVIRYLLNAPVTGKKRRRWIQRMNQAIAVSPKIDGDKVSILEAMSDDYNGEWTFVDSPDEVRFWDKVDRALYYKLKYRTPNGRPKV